MATDPILPLLEAGGHEAVLLSTEPAAGYRGIIALHSTVLGPAAGGTRVWPYPSESEAVVDALRLSRGMTLKNAMAGIPSAAASRSSSPTRARWIVTPCSGRMAAPFIGWVAVTSPGKTWGRRWPTWS
jgi:hypothetical protein